MYAKRLIHIATMLYIKFRIEENINFLLKNIGKVQFYQNQVIEIYANVIVLLGE